MVKQVSHIAVNNLDQNGRSKGKFLDLKTDAGEVLGFERGSYAVKRGLLAFEMSTKQPSHWFYTILRSKEAVKRKTTKNSWAAAKNTEEQDEPTADLFYGAVRTYRCW